MSDLVSDISSERSVSANSSIRQAENSNTKPIILTAILLAISIITIVIATVWLWNLPFGMGSLQIVICTGNGMLMALPVLISIWVALGSQTWLVRIPLAFGAELVLLCVFLFTIASLSPTAPTEIYWLFAGVALAVTFAIQVPLWSLRIWMGVRITRHSKSLSTSDSQFSIKHLLISTTVVAVTIPFAQWLISIGDIDGGTGIPFSVVVGFCTIFISIMLFLAMLSILVVFVRKLRAWCIGIMCIAWFVIPIAILPTLSNVLGAQFAGTNKTDMGINTVAFSVSHSLTLVLAMWLYLIIGFGLRRLKRV